MMMRAAFFFCALLLAWPAFAEGGMRVVVPNRDIARGEVIAAADLTYGTIPANTVFSDIVTSPDLLTGFEARRMLRAGEVLRPQDVRRPVVVTKGAIVTMTFEAPGVSLTATGRAMNEGGVGDMITIQNPVSFRQISGVITGPGTVRAANSELTIASRH